MDQKIENRAMLDPRQFWTPSLDRESFDEPLRCGETEQLHLPWAAEAKLPHARKNSITTSPGTYGVRSSNNSDHNASVIYLIDTLSISYRLRMGIHVIKVQASRAPWVCSVLAMNISFAVAAGGGLDRAIE